MGELDQEGEEWRIIYKPREGKEFKELDRWGD